MQPVMWRVVVVEPIARGRLAAAQSNPGGTSENTQPK